jgi:hypothetical protein
LIILCKKKMFCSKRQFHQFIFLTLLKRTVHIHHKKKLYSLIISHNSTGILQRCLDSMKQLCETSHVDYVILCCKKKNLLPYIHYNETCLNQTLNKLESCINWTLNKVPIMIVPCITYSTFSVDNRNQAERYKT